MRPITIGELQWLLGAQRAPCVSVYLPTRRQPPDSEQDRVRYRNLLQQVEDLLEARLSHDEVRSLLEPLEELAERVPWAGQANGVAVFRSPDVFAHYRLPARVPELAVVSRTFHTRPLIGYLNSNRHFFVLSLSPGGLRLYEGTSEGLVQLDVEGLPGPLRDALQDERGRGHLGLGAHGDTGAGRSTTYHGQGNGGPRDELYGYFRAVDRVLWSFLRDELVPVVLAGLGYYHPIYRAASRYPELLDEGVEGDVERMDLRELHARAMKVIAEQEAQVEGEVLARFEAAVSSGRSGTDLAEVARAAVNGRVRRLLHAKGQHVWGYLDRDTGAVEIHEGQRDAEDADVLDDLAEVVLLRGGDVFELPPERMPRGALVAAVYRY